MNLKIVSNDSLIIELKDKVKEERKLLNEILELLSEVSARRLYLDLAYPSLFEFCVKELGYSTSAAFRRIEAMRLLKSLPVENQAEIKNKISEGSLNLTHLSRIQNFFKMEAKENKSYCSEEKTRILNSLENKSKLEMERELVRLSPQTIPSKPEKVKHLTEDKVSVTLTLDSELLEKIQKLKKLKSHLKADMTTAELLNLLVDKEIKRLEPKPNKPRPLPPAAMEKEFMMIQMGFQRSRYVPASVKQAIWQRDGGCCSFIDHQTGKACRSKHLLQYDHIQEFSKGGTSLNPVNLRLLCSAHHKNRNTGNRLT